MMPESIRAVFSIIGRLCLVTIFVMSAAGKKIPDYSGTVKYMEANGVPSPQVSLALAIVFLILGSLMVLVGYWARIGALLLAVFLVLATYYFHPFWGDMETAAREAQMVQFMKNLGLFGAMLFIIANGSGAGSMDNRRPIS
jgi:putative oxidoreductase